jgi:predicted cupin superfamily sugar epimerase
MTASDVIRLLDLEPLPGEGGYFRQTYRSARTEPAAHFFPGRAGQRFLATAIYYLITPQEFSALHRLDQDELFHFLLGDPVEMLQIDPDGTASRLVMGPGLERGETPQARVPGLVWQGTRLRKGGRWALLGVVVVPGYDQADFQLASREDLGRQFPQHAEAIRSFTH